MSMICSIIFPLSSFMGIVLLLVDGNQTKDTTDKQRMKMLYLYSRILHGQSFSHTHLPPVHVCISHTYKKERRILNVHHPRIIKKRRPHDDNNVNNGIQLSTFTRNDQQTTAHYRQNSELKSSNVILHHKRVR